MRSIITPWGPCSTPVALCAKYKKQNKCAWAHLPANPKAYENQMELNERYAPMAQQSFRLAELSRYDRFDAAN